MLVAKFSLLIMFVLCKWKFNVLFIYVAIECSSVCLIFKFLNDNKYGNIFVIFMYCTELVGGFWY